MIYFDNASTTYTKPLSVLNAHAGALKKYSCGVGRGGYKIAFDAALELENTRELAGRFFNLHNFKNVIFTLNATNSINFALKGILKENDHFIISSFEHNALYRPAVNLTKRGCGFDIAKVDVNDGEQTKRNFLDLIKDNTRLICINHVSNVFGNVLPFEKVFAEAKKRGIVTLLDASQSAGIIDIDMQKDNIDILCCPGHKALMGPMGTGILCINNDTLSLDTVIEGGTGSNSKNIEMPSFLPDRLECGTQNVPGVIALGEAIKFVSGFKKGEILKLELELASYITDALKAMDKITIYDYFVDKTGIFSFNIHNMDCELICAMLDDFDICVRSGFHCAVLAHCAMKTQNTGTVRVSPNIFNTKKQANDFIDAVFNIIN